MDGAPPLFDPDTGEILEAGDAKPPPAQVMSLDDARAMLVRKHGVAVSSDDPILMLVSLHQAMLADYEAMLRRHDGAIQGFLSATGEACTSAVTAVLASLKDKTVKASLDQAFALVERQEQAMERLRAMLVRHRLIHIILTLVSVGGCGLSIAILRSVLR